MGKLARSVSIIGVGYTPIGKVNQHPEIKDLTESELVSWAAQEAMEDAGIKAKDIDAYLVGMSGPFQSANMKGPGPSFADWIGMKNKPCISHDEGCATTGVGLDIAVEQVASGKYDTVISIGVNINSCKAKVGGLPFERNEKASLSDIWDGVYCAFDPAYEKPMTGGNGGVEALAVKYMVDNNMTFKDMDDACIGWMKSENRAGLLNPKALMCQTTLEEDAKAHGCASVEEYLTNPKYNPNVGSVVRSLFLGDVNVDGASAIIVCASDKADQYLKKPIEVAGCGYASGMGDDYCVAPNPMDERLFKEIYAMADVKDPYAEVQYLSVHDCPSNTVMPVSEAAGYFHKGEAWTAMRDGRTAFDGDKPINTTGGKRQLGHPRSPSFGIEVAEAVQQMRGECGERQIKNPPKCSVIWGGGTAWSHAAVVLKTK